MADTTLIRASWHSRFGTITRIIFFTLVVLLLSLSQAAANLRLETRVSVDSNEVTLADLVSGLSPAMMQEHALDRIVIAAAPSPGESRTFQFAIPTPEGGTLIARLLYRDVPPEFAEFALGERLISWPPIEMNTTSTSFP